MDLLIVGRFRAVSTPPSRGGGAVCKIIARPDLAEDQVLSSIGGVTPEIGAYRSEALA
jgi:hypothetical protein